MLLDIGLVTTSWGCDQPCWATWLPAQGSEGPLVSSVQTQDGPVSMPCLA